MAASSPRASALSVTLAASVRSVTISRDPSISFLPGPLVLSRTGALVRWLPPGTTTAQRRPKPRIYHTNEQEQTAKIAYSAQA